MSRILRVALDIRHIRDFGIGSHIRNLVHALARSGDPMEYVLVGRADDISQIPGLPPNFEKAEFPRSDSGTLNQITFPLFLHKFRPDVIHIPLNSVPIFLQRPYVVTVHDMSSLLYRDQGNVSSSRRSYRLFRFRRGLLRASRVLAVSQATQRDIESLLNIPAERISQIYGAVDPQFLQPSISGESQRRQLFERYQVRYPYLLYAGTIRPQKNIPRLIEAFAVLRDELAGHPFYRELRLLIIGDEVSRYPAVRRAVVQSRLEGHVRFFGFVSFDALRMFYSGAEAFVFPSLYEGFGLPPLEAMATGVPVVAASTSSLPEVVGDAAELVNPDNVFDIVRGMREVLLHTSYRQQLIERGREQVRKFDWDTTAAQIREVYREVARPRN